MRLATLFASLLIPATVALASDFPLKTDVTHLPTDCSEKTEKGDLIAVHYVREHVSFFSLRLFMVCRFLRWVVVRFNIDRDTP